MPIRTPAHKQTDPSKAPGVVTLGDYIDQKMKGEPKKLSFEEWYLQEYGDLEMCTHIRISRKAWEAAQKNV